MSFSYILRETRHAGGLMQAQVGERMGCQTSAISKMERGELRLDLLQVRDYCRAVGLPLVDYVEWAEAALANRAEGISPRKSTYDEG